MDFSPYDLLESFMVYQAAYLWQEKEPIDYDIETGPEYPGDVLAIRIFISKAISSGKITAELYVGKSKSNPQVTYFDYDHAIVTRSNLRELAEKKGVKPLFLFPELRSQPAEKPVQAEDKPLGARERNTMLKIIAVMAKAGYGNDMAQPYTLAAEIVRDAERYGVGISKDTVAKYLSDAAEMLGREPN